MKFFSTLAHLKLAGSLFGVVMMALMSVCLPASAFPPAPHHLIYGTVRDEYGTPLLTTEAQIVLTTSTGVKLSSMVVPGLGYGMNFEIEVPMDSGLTPDLYQANALKASAPFKIYVVIGQTTNLPIQMTGNYSLLGKPGQQTRIDLTLGVDANGDGLPDSWEQIFLYLIGSDLDVTNLNSGMRLAGDGLTLQQEFIAGNYPYDPYDPFVLSVVSVNKGAPLLQFTAMTGRNYTLFGSSDLKTWTPMTFSVPAEGANPVSRSYYYAPLIQTMQIQSIQPTNGPTLHFFKMMLQ